MPALPNGAGYASIRSKRTEIQKILFVWFQLMCPPLCGNESKIEVSLTASIFTRNVIVIPCFSSL